MYKPRPLTVQEVCNSDSANLYDAINTTQSRVKRTREYDRLDKRYLARLRRDKRTMKKLHADFALIMAVAQQDPESILFALRHGLLKLTSRTRLQCVTFARIDDADSIESAAD